MTTVRRVGLALLVASALVAAGCSSGGDDSSSPTTDRRATTTTGAKEQPSTTTAPPETTTTAAGDGTTTTTAYGDGSAGKPKVEVTKDPCSLLTDAQVKAALGEVVTSKEDSFNGVFPGCAWGGFLSLYVNVNASYAPDDGVEVAGLGDRALWDKQWHRFYVEDGGRQFLVQCSFCEGEERDTLTTLAKAVIAKL